MNGNAKSTILQVLHGRISPFSTHSLPEVANQSDASSPTPSLVLRRQLKGSSTAIGCPSAPLPVNPAVPIPFRMQPRQTPAPLCPTSGAEPGGATAKP